jgi:hypothetical protein
VMTAVSTITLGRMSGLISVPFGRKQGSPVGLALYGGSYKRQSKKFMCLQKHTSDGGLHYRTPRKLLQIVKEFIREFRSDGGLRYRDSGVKLWQNLFDQPVANKESSRDTGLSLISST